MPGPSVEAKPLRLFFALVPDRRSLVWLRGLQRLRLPGDLRHVRPESMHLTLLFLGACSAAATESLCRVAAGLETPALLPLELEVRDWVLLPSAARPRVVALAFADDRRLEAMHRELRPLAELAGAADAMRSDVGFLPHVTLARIGRTALAVSLPALPGQRLRFSSVGLFASEHGRGGSRYRAVWRSSGQTSGQT